MSEFDKDTNVPANDCISRQAALMGYQGVCEGISCDECPFSIKGCRLERFILNLPSAQSEPKTGRWIKNEDRCGWHCSECMTDNIFAYDWDSETGEYEFQDFYCPHCGVKMEETYE